ncbi:MAG: hypothetical protein ABFS03_05765 [Chloroflexota bacterium]
MKNSYQYHFNYCKACLAELVQYLHTDILYWPLSTSRTLIGHSNVRLTIGAMLLAAACANTLAETALHRRELDDFEITICTLNNHLKTLWSRKAQSELDARLHRWSQYLSDLDSYDGIDAASYRYEIRWRVVLDLLIENLGGISIADHRVLDDGDRRLRGKFSPGDFLWSPDLAKAFPQERFWYLWGSINT